MSSVLLLYPKIIETEIYIDLEIEDICSVSLHRLDIDKPNAYKITNANQRT